MCVLYYVLLSFADTETWFWTENSYPLINESVSGRFDPLDSRSALFLDKRLSRETKLFIKMSIILLIPLDCFLFKQASKKMPIYKQTRVISIQVTLSNRLENLS